MKTEKEQLVEDGVPVTTTANGGTPLVDPQLPIQPNTLLSRFKQMKEKKKTLNKTQ